MALRVRSITLLSAHKIVDSGIVHPRGTQNLPAPDRAPKIWKWARTRASDPHGIARDLEIRSSNFPRLRERQNSLAARFPREQQMLAIARVWRDRACCA